MIENTTETERLNQKGKKSCLPSSSFTGKYYARGNFISF